MARSGINHPLEIDHHNPEHESFDPFAIPMPIVKPGIDVQTAFDSLDKDGNGVIKGEEFGGIRDNPFFNSVSREELDSKYSLFGMTKEMFTKMHGHEAAAPLVAGAFEKHDEDKNDKLFKKEYVKALERLRNGDV
eukprot:SAG22_NODE_955_length_6331_cov_21.329108_8_plen_135_part_00